MRLSKMFGRPSKTEGTDLVIDSHRLLVQAGFIRESTAGRYYLLPLGLRVHEKIANIVRKHMNQADAQELIMPVLHPIELWQETNRTNTAGFELLRVRDRRKAEFALGGTAEEMAVDLIRKFNISYRDLPINFYQFSMKFRDELRARGGLLRVREFVMKDAYSFGTEDQFKATYKQMENAYSAIFDDVGLKTAIVAADNGYIGGEYCHEFISESAAGESSFFVDESSGYAAHEDVATVNLEAVNPDDEMEAMKTIDQPEWVQTMEHNQKHYGKDARFFLKNVVYASREGDLVIVTLRGDLAVNKTKLEQKMKLVGQLEDAAPEDLAAIGTKTGYVHSWGHELKHPRKTKLKGRDARVIYVADESLKTVRNFIGGQKEDARDTINVNYGRDFKHELELDVAMAQAGMLSPDGGELVEKRGVEVGNIFQLGYHYSSLMPGAEYTDDEGKRQKYYMGCYGIGIGRTLAAIVEAYHDDKGIIWPKSVAPAQVHIVSIGDDEDVRKQSLQLYEGLLAANIETLFDDRDETAGVKFADADMIGAPIRLTVSPRTLKENGVELKYRNQTDSKLVPLAEVIAKLTS